MKKFKIRWLLANVVTSYVDVVNTKKEVTYEDGEAHSLYNSIADNVFRSWRRWGFSKSKDSSSSSLLHSPLQATDALSSTLANSGGVECYII